MPPNSGPGSASTIAIMPFCLFPFICFSCVLKGVFVVVYCVWYVLCCCLHGVIKHDDDDDDDDYQRLCVSVRRLYSALSNV